ncbi:tRNA pseudouridine synthase 1 [Mortierella polycephala]|uniref:tRNA pseudouridine synthase 1 n=1 Tax=Mortierella polycephala TaxID=41804 RepID=A0A9P6PU58_9FUNG|nr:tRNA pseudouridine synthase 1 [Mortierella polycephala]
MSNSENNDATTVQQNELVAAAAPVPASAEVTTTLDVNIETISEAGQDQGSGESASKRLRVKIEKEDTSSYIGAKRSKVRGNIRGADKYKGKKGPSGPGSRNAEDAAAIAAKAGESGESKAEGSVDASAEDKEARIPKRKIALLMGYCGTGYQGMQVNQNAKTIEGELFKAMVQAGAVSKDNSDDIKKVRIEYWNDRQLPHLPGSKILRDNIILFFQVSMMRSARTDKGVHAAGNVVSLKMIVDVEDIIGKINACLPEQIRLFGYVRTLNSFNARTLCDSRVYEYLLPTYVFLPRPPLPERSETATTTAVLREDAPEGSLAWDQNVHISTPEEMAEKRKYRIDEATLAKVREGFASYIGTKNFHNFTIGKNFKEKSCQRFMMKFDVSDPKMIQGTEWLSLKVHGQSFMLHQIRKMVALVIMIIRTDTPMKLIPETFNANKINIPKAPSLGLLLERPVFEAYNRKIHGTHQPLEFDPYREEMDAFKEKFIYEGIIKEELDFNRFDEYLQIMDGNAQKFNFGYLNKEGIIPEDAIIKRGDTLQADPSDVESDGES